MGGRKRLAPTMVPIEEHPGHAKVGDSSGFRDEGSAGVAAGSLQKTAGSSSRSRGGLPGLRPLVKLKNAFVELMVSPIEGTRPAPAASYFSMGVVMGPVHFGGYEAVCHYAARDRHYEPR